MLEIRDNFHMALHNIKLNYMNIVVNITVQNTIIEAKSFKLIRSEKVLKCHLIKHLQIFYSEKFWVVLV